MIKPAAQGTGIIAGGGVRAVMEAVGVKDVISKTHGSNNVFNVVKATMKALKSMENLNKSKNKDENKENLMKVERAFHGDTVQTPVNFLIHLENIDYKLLPYEYNMADMVRKEILTEDLLFTKVGWIYHFSGIPNNTNKTLTYHWMKKTYEALYEK